MSFNPDNIKVTSGRDSSYKSSDVKSRPTANPKSRKDFKEVLEKPSDEDDDGNKAKEIIEESDGLIAQVVEEEVKKKSPPSLFDLTSKKTENPFRNTGMDQTISTTRKVGDVGDKKEDVASENSLLKTEAMAENKRSTRTQSPSQMYSQMTASDTKKLSKEPMPDGLDDDFAVNKNKFTTRFATEQTDLSFINPLAAASHQQPSVNLNVGVEKPVMPVSHMQDIINQMVDKVAEIKNTGSTETVITLKNPPGFEGATIVVTAFDHAKNEFNITIENLTQAAKQLVDQQSNRDSLLSSLQQKGYAVHILTTTTIAETRPTIAQLAPEQQQRQQQGEEQAQGRQQRRQDRQG